MKPLHLKFWDIELIASYDWKNRISLKPEVTASEIYAVS